MSPIVLGDATLFVARISDFFQADGTTDSRIEELKISSIF